MNEMPSRSGPKPEDVIKLHQEVNQIMQERLAVTTSAVLAFAAIISWSLTRLPANGARPDTGFFYSIGIGLNFVLGALLFLNLSLKRYARVLTTYLRVTKASVWEEHWAAFHGAKASYMSYTFPQVCVFLFLVLISTSVPCLIALSHNHSFDPTWPFVLDLGTGGVVLWYIVWVLRDGEEKYESNLLVKWRGVLNQKTGA